MELIRTPDQRIRVFISSTIQELAEERMHSIQVIEELRLTPIYFESGARAHPPRELYRAYLDQSDIFIGIYYKSYGWVAPDMAISGIEDEWILAKSKPQLIYIKDGDERHPQLIRMLSAIQNSDASCYRRFKNVEDLTRMLGEDLAVLLSEKFYQAQEKRESIIKKVNSYLPILRNQTIGREKEIEDIIQKLSESNVGLISLIGPGGVGKTRLSIEVGTRIKEQFADGVFFVSLASCNNAEKIPDFIANTIGISGSTDLEKSIGDYFFDKTLLLILDNFEQVIEGGSFLSFLLNRCSHLKMIVSSRRPLNIRNEQIYSVEPLKNHVASNGLEEELSDACKLFMQRVNESNSRIIWSMQNIEAINQLCDKLDGLPLAIELTAARCRYMDPSILVTRFSKLLDSIGSGPNDLPSRQQTIRNTIAWSYDLLDDDAKKLFMRLSIFSNGWSFEDMESICWNDFNETSDIQNCFERLQDFGLVVNMQFTSSYKQFRFIHIIKEFALEKLAQTDEINKLQQAQYKYYQKLAFELRNEVIHSPCGFLDWRLHRFTELSEDFVIAYKNADRDNRVEICISINLLINILYITWPYTNVSEIYQLSSDKADFSESVVDKIDREEYALYLLFKGFVGCLSGRIQEGNSKIMKAYKMSQQNNFKQIESQALLLMIYLASSSDNKSFTQGLVENCIKICDETGQKGISIASEIHKPLIGFERENVKEMHQLLDKIENELNEFEMPTILVISTFQKGFLLIYEEKYDEAEKLFLANLHLEEKFQTGFILLFYIGLSICSWKKNDLVLSMKYLKQGVSYGRKNILITEQIALFNAISCWLEKSGKHNLALKFYARAIFESRYYGVKNWQLIKLPMMECNERLQSLFALEQIENAIASSHEIKVDEIFKILES